VFCTFEASGAMATRVGESVHRVSLVCIMLFGEEVGGALESSGGRVWVLSP
jgi:hypothetical protein